MSGVEDRGSYRESMVKHAKARLKKVQKKFGVPSVDSEPKGLNHKLDLLRFLKKKKEMKNRRKIIYGVGGAERKNKSPGTCHAPQCNPTVLNLVILHPDTHPYRDGSWALLAPYESAAEWGHSWKKMLGWDSRK